MLAALLPAVTEIAGKFIEDKDQKNKLAHEIATLAEKQAHELAKGQLEILKADAKGNWFQASWRPLIGWVGGLSLAINYLISPICAGFGVVVPQADMSVMMPLIISMLGIGGMRSYDKVKKTDSRMAK